MRTEYQYAYYFKQPPNLQRPILIADVFGGAFHAMWPAWENTLPHSSRDDV